jgi:hypothetical protein
MTRLKILAPWTAGAVLFAGAVLIANPVAAQQVVGTTTAVNPLSESAPPGGTMQTVTIGARVVHKEHIHTSPSGGVQLLFLDKSSLSIAPNTDIVIDEFVYDPNSNKGHMLATLTEGALRYVGGELSHQGEATIKTANATIGIRGGTTTVTPTLVIDHYGTITISNGGGTVTINMPGYEVTITGWNIPPGQPTRVTDAEIRHYLRLLTSKNGQNGSGPNPATLGNFDCGSPGKPPCPVPPWFPDIGQNNGNQIVVQGTKLGTSQPPPPPPPRYWSGPGH